MKHNRIIWPIRAAAFALLKLGIVREQKYLDKGWASYAETLEFKVRKELYRFCSQGRLNQLHQEADHRRTARIFERRYREFRHAASKTEVSFKHSGNAGDIIYALPAMKALSNSRPAKIFLKLNVPINNWTETEHPLGKSGLTSAMAGLLIPLLEHQPWISGVYTLDDESVDYDMDLIRDISCIRGGHGHIAHWYFWVFSASADLSQPWLKAPNSPAEKSGRIVLARSARYHNPFLDYRFLDCYGEIDFVGTSAEFLEMQKALPQLRFVECADFLELAGIIASARFFIGNQSAPYAIAEALKVPRVLEVCPDTPDVIPCGPNAAEAFFQPIFEENVERMFQVTKNRAAISLA